MKGAKRILSVFLLLVMLCTFFAFPADAASNLWPSDFSSWKSDNIFVTGLYGQNLDLRATPPANGSVEKTINVVGGCTYRLQGSLQWKPNYQPSAMYIAFQYGKDGYSVLHVKDGVAANYNLDVEFSVPDGVNQITLVVSLVGRCIVVFNDFSITDNSTDKGILNSIKEGFSKLWEWLQGIWDSIKEIPTKIGQFITNLGDRISTFFSNLTNSIKGFFTDLWDKIWNGDGSVPPFDNNNKFAQVIEKLNEWTAKIKEFSGSVDSSADTVTGYLQSGTSFLNSAMGAFPAALTAVLGFALVFIVVRKVVGR